MESFQVSCGGLRVPLRGGGRWDVRHNGVKMVFGLSGKRWTAYQGDKVKEPG